ncbi:CopL family metal-binding regulatory protein [Lysobacter sp. A3-1-A15]|uniref:CopL family metal-binding regulatory protein n=1 Tax=Novilysobacter viscosus TaxID=3098602 RepID=UPI00398301AB
MHRFLALALRVSLILALVLAGPGLSARAVALDSDHATHSMEPTGEYPRAAASDLQDARAARPCHDSGPSMASKVTPETGSEAACCGGEQGCDCSCMHVAAPMVVASAGALSRAYRAAPASSLLTWDIASRLARLNRPPIA